MNLIKKTIIFWQPIVSPHVIYFSYELRNYFENVIYITFDNFEDLRTNQGWEVDSNVLNNMIVLNFKDIHNIDDYFNSDTIHITSGFSIKYIPANFAYKLKISSSKWICMMETIKLNFWNKYIKLLYYRIKVSKLFYKQPDLFLTIGGDTRETLLSLGCDSRKIIEFTYFIKDLNINVENKKKYNILFIGNLTKNKNVILLLKALNNIKSKDFILNIYGSGPEKNKLINYVDKSIYLKNKVIFNNKIQMSKIPSVLNNANLLVLPSKHDGWGVVVTEALLCGVPCLVSKNCGSKIAVKLSGFGDVFDNFNDLLVKLDTEITKGNLTDFQIKKLVKFGKNFTAKSGAKYFLDIYNYLIYNSNNLPIPPWKI
jgi:glycosyltransferase involved in cell wall biosynthesis